MIWQQTDTRDTRDRAYFACILDAIAACGRYDAMTQAAAATGEKRLGVWPRQFNAVLCYIILYSMLLYHVMFLMSYCFILIVPTAIVKKRRGCSQKP
jgi:predicted membrane-bound mannosyltransferase